MRTAKPIRAVVRMMIAIAALCLMASGTHAASTAPAPLPQHWDGSRVVPVHRIVLYDETGEDIVPSYDASMPFSARKTCGACHDYQAISAGFHFNSMATNARPGRAMQPWIWVDERSGVQIPISYRDVTNTWRPASLGLTPWQMVKQFGRHMPGGGPGEALDVPDPASRWEVSGPLEINCLGCHSASPKQDQSEWAKQVMRENFRWSATAAAGFGDVGGMASRMWTTWDAVQGPNKDDKEYAVAPNVRYDLAQFDRKNRVLVDIDAKPKDARCLYCHSVAVAAQPKIEADADVHSRAGIACVDCHRNDLGHDTIRGYESEAKERGNDARVQASSCCGCHLGNDAGLKLAGRLGAPAPAHKGFPPIHFDKLACTVCHSGPMDEEPVRVKTSRANRLGVYGVARWATDVPAIVEPVYMKGSDGKIAPHRMMWPAFWGVKSGASITPVNPAIVTQTVGSVLFAEEAVARVLAALAQEISGGGELVYVAGSNVFRGNADGGLDWLGGATAAADCWAIRTNELIQPLVVVPASCTGELDRAVVQGIESVLFALDVLKQGSNQPVACIGTRVFGIDANGMLAQMEGIVGNGAADTVSWQWLAPGTTFSPLVPEFITRAVAELAGSGCALTEDQLVRALALFAERDATQQYVYISGGKVFELKNNALVASDHPAADPCAWPAVHNVRPSAQSRGVKQCTDCHSYGSKFFFAKVTAQGPLKTSTIRVASMWEFERVDGNFNRLFGFTFLVRTMYKTVMFSLAGLIGLALLLAGLRIVTRAGEFFASGGDQ